MSSQPKEQDRVNSSLYWLVTIKRRVYCPPTPQCSVPPNYKGTRLLRNRNCQPARTNITEHCCRTSKLKVIPPFAAKWMNGISVKCHLPNAQKDCKTRERVNFLWVGQIEEWMEWQQLCKMVSPPSSSSTSSSSFALVPIIPLLHNNPITLTMELSRITHSLDPIIICKFHAAAHILTHASKSFRHGPHLIFKYHLPYPNSPIK